MLTVRVLGSWTGSGEIGLAVGNREHGCFQRRRDEVRVVGELAAHRVRADERQAHLANRAVALLADDDLGNTFVFGFLVVDLVTVDKQDHVCILFDGTRFTKI